MSVKKSAERSVAASQEQGCCYETLIDLRKRLQFHRAMGIAVYPRNEEVELFLEKSAPGRFRELHNSSPGEETELPTDSSEEQSSLASLGQEIPSCKLCHLSTKRQGTVGGSGQVNAQLMLVGDWSRQESPFREDVLFGPQEDAMLWKMMTAIDLDRTDVYVTNCIKCCPQGPIVPDAEAETRCFSYLEREIAAVKPQVICAMGDTAARVLLGSRVPLVRSRGKLGSYRYQSSEPIAVIPTFHPNFLLTSPEMKKATWNDLQVIRRFLDGRQR